MYAKGWKRAKRVSIARISLKSQKTIGLLHESPGQVIDSKEVGLGLVL